jgi:outer membrane receptor protein involved in Fe transport
VNGGIVLHPTGDSTRFEPLAFTHEWSGLAKITNRSLKNIEFNYQAVFNRIYARKADYVWHLNPDGLSRQSTFSITHGLDVTHTLNKNTYYTLNFRRNYFDYRDRVYDDLRDLAYDAAGVPIVLPSYGSGANVAVQGVQQTRFRQETVAWLAKGSLVSQLDPDQQVKAGYELQWPDLRFGALGYIEPRVVNGVFQYVRIDHAPPDFPGVVTYRPFLGAAFGQEELEWNDLKLRAGLRFEFFDARSSLPSDLKNPANALPLPTPQSVPKRTTAKTSFAPRIGVSYPVTKDAALFFAYGHFYQLPPLGTTFKDADYNVLATLQAGTNNFRVMGNPDIKPERTVQYQFGYRQAVNEGLGFEANVFYKDIRDLLGVQFISTYNDADYARLTNVDFGNVIGVTVSLDQRAIGLFSASMDYTWQVAQGNSSKPEETATRAEAGQDPRPRLLPFDWDQRHTLNLTLTMARPDAYTASLLVRVTSGQPFTPTVATGLSSGPETNSGRKPAAINVDLRAERQISIGGANASLFTRVFNVFDTRFFNGFVFGSTGSPYYSQSPTTDRAGLRDPTRFYGPRRIEVGITMGAGQEP